MGAKALTSLPTTAGTGQIRIPKTIEAAVESLNGLGALLTAKEFERAAIVYAFTRDGEGGTPDHRSDSTTVPMLPREFAALGISGLKSDQTVRVYRKAWQTVIDDGQAVEVAPGDSVTLPTRGWPPTDPRTGHFPERVQTQVSNLPIEDRVQIARTLVADPIVADKISEDIISVADLLSDVSEAIGEPRQSYPLDYSKKLRMGTGALLAALTAEKEGEWTPSALEEELIDDIGRVAIERRQQPAAGREDVFTSIKAHLQAVR